MPEPEPPIRHQNRLKHLREAADESRAELAVALGLTTDVMVERWETGRYDIPIYRARAIAERYGVSLSHLLCDPNGDQAAA